MKIVDDVTSVVSGFERGCLVQPWGEERVPLTPWLEGTLAQVGFVWSRGRRICVAARRPRGWSRNGRARPHRDAEAAVTPLPARIVTARYGIGPRLTARNGDACQALGKAPPDHLRWVWRSRLRTPIIPVQLCKNCSEVHSRRPMLSPAAFVMRNDVK